MILALEADHNIDMSLFQVVAEIVAPLGSLFDVPAIKKSPTPPMYYGPPEAVGPPTEP